MDQPVVVLSKMRKPSLVVGSYDYRVHRKTQNKIRWACRKDKQTGCKGRLSTDFDNNVIPGSESDHTCVPDVEGVEIKKVYETCRKRVMQEVSVPVNKIFKEEFSKMYSKGLEFEYKVPRYDNVKGQLCKERRNVLGSEQTPKDSASIEFPASLLQLPNGDQFLIAAKMVGSGKKIYIFGGMDSMDLITKGSICFFDGTFKNCPKQFEQIYTIFVDVGSTEYDTHICPALFVLLPDKLELTYKSMLELIKVWCPSWSPILVKIDFEIALISAIKCVFPETVISGCSSQFKKCLWNHILEIGLVDDYRENEDVRRTCKKCAVLAYLPLHVIQDAWLIILNDAPQNDKLDEFLAYFVDHWLESVITPPEVWNVFNQRHRTNKAVEVWNRKLKSMVGIVKQPNIYFLVEVFKKMALEATLYLEGKELNEIKTACEAISEQMEEKILREFELSQNLEKCLNALACVKNFE